jgi:hypothetical protein
MAQRDVRMCAAESPRGLQDGPRGIHADDRTTPAHARGQITQHHAGATAHLEHALPATHRHEAQEAGAQPDLRARAAARFEARDHRTDVGLRVDRPPRIPLGHGRRQPAKRSAQAVLQK